MEEINEEFVDEFDEDISEEEFEHEDVQEGGFDVGNSEPSPPGGIYRLFDIILNKPKSTKVSNINQEELGSLGISVREAMRISLLGKTFGHPRFADFFMQNAGIISDSAMSKDGWFTELIVTSKNYASRTSSSHVKTLPKQSNKKWKMFSAKKQVGQEQ